jgi:hypothetical protein
VPERLTHPSAHDTLESWRQDGDEEIPMARMTEEKRYALAWLDEQARHSSDFHLRIWNYALLSRCGKSPPNFVLAELDPWASTSWDRRDKDVGTLIKSAQDDQKIVPARPI